MIRDKWQNDTFSFRLNLVLYNKSKSKDLKAISKLFVKLGYDYDSSHSTMNGIDACVLEKDFDIYIVINKKALDSYKYINKNLNKISVLAHECNHVKEKVLQLIGEHEGNKETEAAMRISDWCFKKCMETKYFKSILK